MSTIYEGPLHQAKMHPTARKAFYTWYQQLRRCQYPTNRQYRWYGAKGIRVEYSSREFIGWYLAEAARRDISNLVVGRIDHAQNYRFGNIELQTATENAKERIARCGGFKARPILIRRYSDGAFVAIARDSAEATRITGIRHISEYASGKWKRNGAKDYLLTYALV